MGIDLRLYVFREMYSPDSEKYIYKKSDKKTWWFGLTTLYTSKCYRFYDFIGPNYGRYGNETAVNLKPIPKDIEISIYKDDGLENNIKLDCFGNELLYFTAGDINNIPDKEVKIMSSWVQGIISFLKNIDPDCAVMPYYN